MVQSEVIKKLKSIAAEILPENSTLYLYGTSDDYDMTYPFYDFGLDIGQYVSTHIYTKKQWRSWTFLPYYKNVEHDKIVLK